MNAKELVDFLIEKKILRREELKGCSEKEIDDLEIHFGHKFPKAFREFLSQLGHNAGNFRRGTKYLYKDLFTITDYTRTTLEDGPFKLPLDAFVFSAHQGYIFAYFLFSDGDDPPIYTYMEHEPQSEKWANNFSE